ISVNTRSAVWDACLEILHKKWLYGLGPGVGNVRNILVEEYGIKQPHAHNIFLQLFLEGGIIGISLFTLLIIWIAVELVKLCLRSKEGRPLAVGIIASIAGILTCGITDYVLYGPKVLQYFLMILGLALAAKRIYTQNATDEQGDKSEKQEKTNVIGI
ncbi:MAG: O-antigen ligase family protein, partial [Eubacteriales bacterium]